MQEVVGVRVASGTVRWICYDSTTSTCSSTCTTTILSRFKFSLRSQAGSRVPRTVADGRHGVRGRAIPADA
eukprot:2701540-Rhodomonas_salina.2